MKPILVADAGATKTDIGLLQHEDGGWQAMAEQRFVSKQYEDMGDLIEAFLKDVNTEISTAAIGVPGPVTSGRCTTTNLPWDIEADRIAARFGLNQVHLLNDLEAAAFGIAELTCNELVVLNEGNPRPGHRVLIAAGSGLGEAQLFWDGEHHYPIASEGGHSDFAPRDEVEIDLLRYLQGRFGHHVSYERLLSGPGLVNIYDFLKDTKLENEPAWISERMRELGDRAAAISAAAFDGDCPICERALDMFVSIYGAEAGNMALKCLPAGGVFIGGGIAPKILCKLLDGTFMQAFTDKGRFASLLADVPVYVIRNAQVAMLGAASYARMHEAPAG
ncbi:MAG: glucokinase [Mariprofundaceae bacterium]